jgi:hypothetical protein
MTAPPFLVMVFMVEDLTESGTAVRRNCKDEKIPLLLLLLLLLLISLRGIEGLHLGGRPHSSRSGGTVLDGEFEILSVGRGA